jgi:ribosomal peptide maturation radical SAM protein 1
MTSTADTVGAVVARPAAGNAAGSLGNADVARRAAWTTVLLSMPLMDVDRPSIQLGLLKSIGTAHNFPVHTWHAYLDFAAQIGADEYRLLSAHRGRLVAEWLFSLEAFGTAAPDPDSRLVDDFAEDLSYLGEIGEARDLLLRVRHREVPAYLDSIVNGFTWQDVRVVGFTATFQQNAASFALAHRLKQRHPHLVTVFGGANFDGEMGLELLRCTDFIDFAVIGEGDIAFPGLMSALADGTDPGAVAGVARRVGDEVIATPPAPPLRRLDDAGIPDYDEYFERAERLGIVQAVGHRNTWIPIETARGCWWGAKHHCTFCGLNGNSMQFRAKSPRRVLDELAHQARRYRSFMFEAVDNILDLEYLTKLFPAIVDSGADYRMFYEIKANVTRAQLRLLAQSGVDHIQPGLESLSSNVLRLMRKGIRAAQNVNLLRWARYYGIDVLWNILWGFPGETRQDYDDQQAVVPHLVHLQPPSSTGRISMERFSPIFNQRDQFPVRSMAPEASYRYVYPDTVDLDRVAYFFEYEFEDALPDDAYNGLRAAVTTWSRAWNAERRPELTYWYAPDFLQIYDSRRQGHEGTYTFHGALANIYLACSDRPTTASAVTKRLALDLPVEQVQETFGEFQKRGLMFLDGTLAVALALPSVAGR